MKMSGRLGNQMFQYALGRHLSIINNQPLKISHLTYPKAKIKPDSYKDSCNFNLFQFDIKAQSITKEELVDFGHIPFLKKVYSSIEIYFFKNTYYKQTSVKEPVGNNQIFDQRILKFPYKDVYFRGFWQSEKYFIDIRDVIISDFTVKEPPDKYNSSVIEKINSTNSISLHFRRGNNTNPDNSVGTLSFDYYQKAVDYITNKIKDPHFYIFSDDIVWVKNNFKINFPHTYIENDLDKDCDDIRLMSNCKHHITANSTFSWWGAWLCTNPNKIVVVPERNAQNIDRLNPDLYPESWIKIK